MKGEEMRKGSPWQKIIDGLGVLPDLTTTRMIERAQALDATEQLLRDEGSIAPSADMRGMVSRSCHLAALRCALLVEIAHDLQRAGHPLAISADGEAIKARLHWRNAEWLLLNLD